MFNQIIRRLLFKLEPEAAHAAALTLLRYRGKIFRPQAIQAKTIEIMGLRFPNCVGLAAGFDKNAQAIDGLASLGFGHIEIGTVTPKAQAGNSKPRLFRRLAQQAIINRMGFNNQGVAVVLENIKRSRYRGILGINIGKNVATSLADASNDYLYCLRAVYPYASYVTINISSPNTANLRILQADMYLTKLLAALKKMQHELSLHYKKYVPLVVKIAPDLSALELQQIANTLLDQKIDGVIAANTSATELGGLSGAPLTDLSTHVITLLSGYLQGKLPIIASGGIMTRADALHKMQAGASLVQLYTGLLYRGTRLIREIIC